MVKDNYSQYSIKLSDGTVVYVSLPKNLDNVNSIQLYHPSLNSLNTSCAYAKGANFPSIEVGTSTIMVCVKSNSRTLSEKYREELFDKIKSYVFS